MSDETTPLQRFVALVDAMLRRYHAIADQLAREVDDLRWIRRALAVLVALQLVELLLGWVVR